MNHLGEIKGKIKENCSKILDNNSMLNVRNDLRRIIPSCLYCLDGD